MCRSGAAKRSQQENEASTYRLRVIGRGISYAATERLLSKRLLHNYYYISNFLLLYYKGGRYISNQFFPCGYNSIRKENDKCGQLDVYAVYHNRLANTNTLFAFPKHSVVCGGVVHPGTSARIEPRIDSGAITEKRAVKQHRSLLARLCSRMRVRAHFSGLYS